MRAKVVELPLVPGSITDDTELATKLRASAMDKVRWRGNRPETIRGWELFSATGMTAGIPRGGHSWSDVDGNKIVLVGSETAVNVWLNGTQADITPYWKDVFIKSSSITTPATNQIKLIWDVYTAADSTSTVADHDLKVGDLVTISGAACASGGGVIDFNGTFPVESITNSTTVILTASGTTSSAPSNAACIVTVAFRPGLPSGGSDMADAQARVWSVSNFGDNGVLCGSDGTPIFYFQPANSYPELVRNGGFSPSTGWSGWSFGGAQASIAGTADDLTQDMSAVLVGGKTYEMSFDITACSAIGTLKVKMDTTQIFPTLSGGTSSRYIRTYTFRFVCPADPTNLTFNPNGSTLSIDNVSIKLLDTAHPINEAPQVNRALFVDSNHILTSLGTVEADGDFNPLLARWCAQDNYREWVPDTDNIAGELNLLGSRAICGGPVGPINLVITDDAAIALSFTESGYALTLIGTGCGAAGARSLAVHNNIAFWAGLKGFHVFDGARVLNVECPLKDSYVGKIRQYQENKTFAWVSTEFGEVWFHFAHTDDGSEISRYFIYNFLEQGNPWSFGTFDRTMMIRPSVYQNPIGLDAAGRIWSHETGTAMPEETLPFIETGYVTAEAGDKWIGCRRYYPDIEGQVGNILFTTTGKRAPQGQNNTEIRGPHVIVPNAPTVDYLLSCRQLKFRWESADTPTRWRLGIVGLEMKTEKERR